jgi:hypothetical protein
MTAQKDPEVPWADREVAKWRSDQEFVLGDSHFVTRPTNNVRYALIAVPMDTKFANRSPMTSAYSVV